MIIRAKLPVERRVRAVRVYTRHVPKASLLEDQLLDGFFVVVPWKFGAMYERIGDEKPTQEDWEQVLFREGIEVYKWLLALHQWCREQKIDVIIFDRHEATLPGLPTFDW